MQMGRGRGAGIADRRDDLALVDTVTGLDIELAAMEIGGDESVAVIDLDKPAGAGVVAGPNDRAASGCLDRRTGRGAHVDGRVEMAVVINRMDAVAVTVQLPGDGLERWDVGQLAADRGLVVGQVDFAGFRCFLK